MATQQDVLKKMEASAIKYEDVAEAGVQVLKSEGDQDIQLPDGSTTPNLNKRLKGLVKAVSSVVGKTGDVTAEDIAKELKEKNVDLPTNTSQEKINLLGGTDYWRNKKYPVNGTVRLDNGDVVVSTIQDNTNNPNEDMTGWVNHDEEQRNVNTVGNKTGLTFNLAETVDATPFLQALIDNMVDGMTLDLLGKTFRIKKNSGFQSDYPDNSQPCLVIKGKKNIKLTNGKLVVKEHAQTAIDAINSTGVINNLIIQGAGNFPPLYLNTGRGEKGLSDAGYFNEPLYNSGQPRNNSVDTSGFTGGNYGANGFPQWGGGYGSTWGVWNGGYIFNIGDGIFLQNSNFKIEACDIYGFNGNGIVINEGSVTIERNKLHDCYTAGFFAKSYGDGARKTIELVEIANNEVYNIGHPDSKRTDLVVDPGYGVSTSNKGSSTQGVRSYKVFGNSFKNCKRKAVDAHHSYFASAYGNRIETCGYGIFVTINDYGNAPKSTIVTGNFIRDIHMAKESKGVGIDVTSMSSENSGFEGSVIIDDNYIEDVGVPKDIFNAFPLSHTGLAITVNGIEDAIITNNSIKVTDNCIANAAIMDGSTGATTIPRSIITNNHIKGKMLYGIFSRKNNVIPSSFKTPTRSIIMGNIVDVHKRDDQSTATGISATENCKVSTNTIVPRTGVVPYVGINPSGYEFTFDLNMSTKEVMNIVQPGELSLSPERISVTVQNVNTLQVQLPSDHKVLSMSFNEKSTLRTSAYYGVRFSTGSSFDQYIKLSFYTTNNGVASVLPVADVSNGVLSITVKVK